MRAWINKNSLILYLALTLILAMGTLAWADDDPLSLVSGNSGTSTRPYYVGEDVPGFKWDIYFLDYYKDEWRMNKVREYGGVEYYVGNRIPYGNSNKRYAVSASVYHSSMGDVISFVSLNWQAEKSFVYNMVRQTDSRFYGCEYWVGANRFDNYYFRNAYIDLKSGTFGGNTINSTVKAVGNKQDIDNATIMGVPPSVWYTADEEILKMRLEPEQYEETMNSREAEEIQ